MRSIATLLFVLFGAVGAGAGEPPIFVSSSIIPAAQISRDALLLPGRDDSSCNYNLKEYCEHGRQHCRQDPGALLLRSSANGDPACGSNRPRRQPGM